MCGITGFIEARPSKTEEQLEVLISTMCTSLRHRGPDDQGVWLNASEGVALGFRRLAILDLSPTGNQPMHSADNRYTIVYNGEIYNFRSIRSELENKGHNFTGTSDTEVILAAASEWGVIGMLGRLNGMFALALWDNQEKLLHLARDRVGVKPLYYGWQGRHFFFASELKAIRQHPDFQVEIDPVALGEYFRFGYVPTPLCIYKQLNKLEPASLLTIDPASPGGFVRRETYWKLNPDFGRANGDRDENDFLAELERLLLDSIKSRMISDVPLGAFLSGGIDSSTVVALMQAQSSEPIKTFTIGFLESGFNEAEYAKDVAAHLGTEHTELYVRPEDAMAVIPYLPEIYDEPFADPSQIPTFLVSKLAREKVTVSLSGDGGDELFLGYNRYRWAQKIWRTVGWIPPFAKQWLSTPIQRIPASTWDNSFNKARPFLPRKARIPQFGDKLQKFAKVLNENDPHKLYEQLVTFWPPGSLVQSNRETINFWPDNEGARQSFSEWMSYTDLHTYLPDDILVKVDRASMAVSLEARVPFIDDHHVVEFATALPQSMKIRHGESKWLLRQLLYKYVPKNLVERPKMGFGVPIDSWLRTPLRDWANHLIDPRRLKREGIVNADLVSQKWQEHLDGSHNWQYHLWNVITFEAWLDAHHQS